MTRDVIRDGPQSPEPQSPEPQSREPQPLPPAGRRSQFLEDRTYRRARLEDAARLLPVIGLCLLVSPIAIQSTAEGGGGTVAWLFFFGAVWVLLIVAAAIISRALRRSGRG